MRLIVRNYSLIVSIFYYYFCSSSSYDKIIFLIPPEVMVHETLVEVDAEWNEIYCNETSELFMELQQSVDILVSYNMYFHYSDATCMYTSIYIHMYVYIHRQGKYSTHLSKCLSKHFTVQIINVTC